MKELDSGEKFIEWAQSEGSVRALVLIGSRARPPASISSSDQRSDWDFQIIGSNPRLFTDGAWLSSHKLQKPLVYTTRRGRLGRVMKITAVFKDVDIDISILPMGKIWMAKMLWTLGLYRYLPGVRDALSELAMLLMPGYSILKTSSNWKCFFDGLANRVGDKRIRDEELCEIANGFVCDYVSTVQKMQRGELIAAQRWLHCQLGETNFRLWHELRQRRGELSFPDGRRIEKLSISSDYRGIMINASLDRSSLQQAVESSAETFRNLMNGLVGAKWQWPALPLRLRGE